MKKLGKLLRNLLIVCGVLFIIVLLLPDEEEMPADQEQTSVETASGIGTQTGTETASGAETLVGAEHVAGTAENSFPEDMVKEKQTEIKGDGKDQATVFVYMNGSDLESEAERRRRIFVRCLRRTSAARSMSSWKRSAQKLVKKAWDCLRPHAAL